MILTEYFTTSRETDEGSTKFLNKSIPKWVVNVYRVVGVFAFGAASSQLITDIMKYMVGRLRPHFFAVCMPFVDCTDKANLHRYITNFNCTNPAYKVGAHIYKEMRYVGSSNNISVSGKITQKRVKHCEDSELQVSKFYKMYLLNKKLYCFTRILKFNER